MSKHNVKNFREYMFQLLPQIEICDTQDRDGNLVELEDGEGEYDDEDDDDEDDDEDDEDDGDDEDDEDEDEVGDDGDAEEKDVHDAKKRRQE